MSKKIKLYNILNSPIEIPTNDFEAYNSQPKFRFLYNKILLCEYQNIPHNPMPIKPDLYPVILKPIINLYGMGLYSKKILSEEEFNDNYLSVNFWMEYFEGEH
jgi:hypothetical protein